MYSCDPQIKKTKHFLSEPFYILLYFQTLVKHILEVNQTFEQALGYSTDGMPRNMSDFPKVSTSYRKRVMGVEANSGNKNWGICWPRRCSHCSSVPVVSCLPDMMASSTSLPHNWWVLFPSAVNKPVVLVNKETSVTVSPCVELPAWRPDQCGFHWALIWSKWKLL